MDGANVVGFLRHALEKKKNPLKHDRAIGNMALVDKTLRMSTSHFMMLDRSVVESADFFISETWLEKHFSALETFSADSDDVSVWWSNHLDLHRRWS